MTVLEYLQTQNLEIDAPCGGNGTCGKCLVRVKMPYGRISLHKACQITYKEGMSVEIVDNPSNMTILSYNTPETGSEGSINNTRKKVIHNPKTAKYGVAIDVGTTTIAGVLFNMDSDSDEKIICDSCVVNSGGIYGSDVITRVRAATEGKSAEITALLKEDISIVISDLIMKTGIKDISGVAIAANTVMSHFINGFDVSGIGKYPYKTVDTDLITTDLGTLTGGFGFTAAANVYIMPGTGAFIGGDILSGIFGCGLAVENKNTLFIDLGTNGEMALSDGDVIYTASTAAGPVFEGSSITFGMPASDGAICSFELNNSGETMVKTINNLPPKGICGTGIIEICSELLKAGKISPEGVIEEPFKVARKNDGSYILFTQEDVRQIQLAKAAIRTGVNILLEKLKLSYNDIKKVYLAGGFGYNTDIKKASAIGMLPEELISKTVAAGNTSLKGAVKFLTGDIEENIKTLDMIKNKCRYTDLALEEDFREQYMNEINFRS